MHALLFYAWQSITACTDVGALNLLRSWPTATVAEAERLQVHGNTCAILFHQVPDTVLKFLGLNRAVVIVPRRQVRENFRAIKTTPTERHIGELVCLAPTHLVRDECVEASLRHDLRQACRKSEGIRQVEKALRCRRAEARIPVCATMQYLTNETLAGWTCAIGLNPHGASSFPTPFGNTCTDLCEELRRPLLDPCILLRLAAKEMKVRKSFL